jgi:replicative superfamily II helicase
MVDFSKRLAKKDITKRVDPIELYDTLDRASDKGELRTAQRAILAEWHQTHRSNRDLIVKLHTGQGKTLIGLLMLQSKLNEGIGPALYLCPNNFLIDQTCLQAKQFGIAVCTADLDIPQEFLNSEVILVTSVQKLFNGLTKFGLGPKSKNIGTLLMDDSHACIDAIRDAFCITLPNDHDAYDKLTTLFTSDLERQGAGTFSDIVESEATMCCRCHTGLGRRRIPMSQKYCPKPLIRTK